ncbi:nuclear transport factor 2 family protein [Fibrella aquatilis]|nr:nuclear transport factor 2 family protein [Fibrella aquatilis]
MEIIHSRLLDNWIRAPTLSFIHPHCVWKLAEGQICPGIHQGCDFHGYYQRQIDSTYPEWHEIVSEVIGSRIGDIVVGKYQFKRQRNGLWYNAPFARFYRIQGGQIVSVHYYMGAVSTQLSPFLCTTDSSTYVVLHSLN